MEVLKVRCCRVRVIHFLWRGKSVLFKACLYLLPNFISEIKVLGDLRESENGCVPTRLRSSYHGHHQFIGNAGNIALIHLRQQQKIEQRCRFLLLVICVLILFKKYFLPLRNKAINKLANTEPVILANALRLRISSITEYHAHVDSGLGGFKAGIERSEASLTLFDYCAVFFCDQHFLLLILDVVAK